MVGKKKVFGRKVFSTITFVIGFLICSYPLFSSIIEQRYQKDTVATYEKAVEGSSDEGIDEEWGRAHHYNSMLHQTEGILISDIDTEVLSEENYNSLLDLSGTGVMGSVEIPKINVNLPIYHGTDDEVLDVGVGHVMNSSLPVGGENTRTVLTGHRGLPNSKLFTRLDELEEGDLFFIRVLGDTLAYRVCDISVIDPEDVSELKIQDGKDLATLLTCTPYGINTHRLIVTGERVAYEKAEYVSIEGKMMSFRELLFACVPFIFLGIGIVKLFIGIKRSKEVSKNEIKEN